MAEGGTVLCIVLTSIMAFISCFLLGYSFDTLEPDKYALMFNKNTRELECDRVYGAQRGQGSRRFFTGLGRGFYDYRFSLPAKTILYSSTLAGAQSGTIVSKTSEGATVTMDIALQYTLPRDPTTLCNLVYAYGFNYESFLVNYARSVTRDVLSQYAVYDLWQHRPDITSAMRAAVSAEFARHFTTLVNFQLLSLQIPSALQAEIETTTVAYQKIFQAQLNLQAQNVSAITNQLQVQVTAQVTVINAAANANATIIDARAKAAAQNVTSVNEALGYMAFKRAFNLTNAQLLELAYIDALVNTDADRVAISAPAPTVVH